MYQQNQLNLQPKNPTQPIENPQPCMSFRSVTSPYPNNLFRHQQLVESPRSYGVSMETNIYSTNHSHKNQSRCNVTSTIVRPSENTFSYQGSNMANNFYNKPPYLANGTSENNFVLPKTIQTFGISTRSLQTVPSPSVQYPTASKIFPQNNPVRSFIPEKNYIQESQRNAKLNNETVTDFAKRKENEKIRIFTGTAEKVIKWHKIYKNYFCYYEIVASIVSIQEGSVSLQKIMLLRDNKGPIIQIVHYVWDHINIENFFVGQMLRCIGRMVGPNIMHGLSIREASTDEVATLQRMCYISDHAISKALTKV